MRRTNAARPRAARPVLTACALLAIMLAASRPASAQPAEGTPAEGTPAEGTPAEGTPAEGTPAEGTPAEAPAEETRQATPEEIKIARKTAIEGLTAYKSGEFEKALGLFESARAVYPSAQILRMTGYSHLALQHWKKSAEALEEALASQTGALDEDDRKDVKTQLKKALAHLGSVRVSSTVEGAELLVDIEPPRKLPLQKPVRLVEGRHLFVVIAPKHTKAERSLRIEGGTSIELTLDPTPETAGPKPKPKPKPKPPPPPPPEEKPWTGFFPHQKEIGIAAAGTGLALGGVALITGLAGADLRATVEDDVARHQQGFGDNCERGGYRLCVYDRALINQDADRADTLRDVSLWTGIASGVLVAGGAALFLLAPGSPFALGPSPKRDTALACGTLIPSASPLGAGLACKGSF